LPGMRGCNVPGVHGLTKAGGGSMHDVDCPLSSASEGPIILGKLKSEIGHGGGLFSVGGEGGIEP